MKKSERLRLSRIGAGFKNASEAARAMGVNKSTYISHENGTRDFNADTAALYARKFKVVPEWLTFERGDAPKVVTFDRQDRGRVVTFDRDDRGKVVTVDRARGEPVQIATSGGPSLIDLDATKLPVYSAAQGGKGHLIVTFEPVDWKSPPADILTAREAYGIMIVGDSMVPAYEPGDIAWVTPYRPLQRGKDYVFYHGQPSGEAEAMIKRLLSFTDRELKLRQWNPQKDFAESVADWPVRHQIHSTTNG